MWSSVCFWPGADVDGEALESKKSAMTFPIAPAIALLAYTVLSFVLAVKASGIMAALKGSEWETQLEEITAPKASWRGVSSITGYNPLNQRLWWAIARLSDLPDGVRPKVKSLKTLLVVQSVVFIATVALAVAWLFGV